MKKMKKENFEKYKRKAHRYIHSNTKYSNVLSDVNLNEIEDNIKQIFSNYNEFLDESNQTYNKLRGGSTDFLKGYAEIKKSKEIEQKQIKDKKLMSPFLDLINEYNEKGYKISSLENMEKNIFKPSILIEENNKLNQYFKINKFSKKEKKEIHYLKKVKNCVKKEEEKIMIQKKKKNLEQSDLISEYSERTIKKRDLSSDSLPQSQLSQITKRNMNITHGNLGLNFIKLEQQLTKYNENIKTLIQNEEEERIKNNSKINKESYPFPMTTKNIKYNKMNFRKNNSNSEKTKTNNNNNNNNINNFSISQSIRNKSNVDKTKKTIVVKSQKNVSSYLNFVNGTIRNVSRGNNKTNTQIDLPEVGVTKLHSRNRTLSTTFNDPITKDSFMANSNGEIKDFLKVVTKTKNKIANYNFDRVKRIILSRNSNDYTKKMINNIKKLDKKILHLDKDLIKAIEDNKTIS